MGPPSPKDDAMQSESDASLPLSRPPYRVLLSCTGVSLLAFLFFLFFPFLAFLKSSLQGMVWGVSALTGLILSHPKPFFALAGACLLWGLCTGAKFKQGKGKQRFWRMVADGAVNLGLVALVCMSLLFVLALALSNSLTAAHAVDKAQEQVSMLGRTGMNLASPELLATLVPRAFSRPSYRNLGTLNSKPLWEAQHQGQHVILTRTSSSAPECRSLMSQLKDYQLQVNGRPAAPGACNAGWSNTLKVSLPIPSAR